MKNLVLIIIFTLFITTTTTANNSNKLNCATTAITSPPSTNDEIIFNHVEINNVISTDRQVPLMDEEIKKVKSPASKAINQAPPAVFNPSKLGV